MIIPRPIAGTSIELLPLWRSPFNVAAEMLPTLEIAVSVVLFVLLIACANVGTLLLVRSLLRQPEMTARLAFGAGRGRLLQQLLTEGLILSALATAGGIVVAYWCRNALVLAFPSQAPGIIVNLPGHIDWRVLALSTGVCVFATVLFALAPAVQASKIDLASAINSGSTGVVGGRGRSRLRAAFVLIQMSLEFCSDRGRGSPPCKAYNGSKARAPASRLKALLLSGVDFFRRVTIPNARELFKTNCWSECGRCRASSQQHSRRVIPFGLRDFSSAPIAVEGYKTGPDERPMGDYNQVGPDYFGVMGVPIVAGREFTRADDDGRPLVAIVDETMAAKYWPGKDPIGALSR